MFLWTTHPSFRRQCAGGKRGLECQRNSSWKAKLAQGCGELERKRLLLSHQHILLSFSQAVLPAGEKLWTSSRSADTPEPRPRRGRAGAKDLGGRQDGFRLRPLTWESKHGQVPLACHLFLCNMGNNTCITELSWRLIKRFLNKRDMYRKH